jgi:very-short-patch-repair endonuclease
MTWHDGVLFDAVVAVDALAGRFGFAPEEVLGHAERYRAERYRGARGTLRLPEVIRLAAPAAESAMESRLRLTLVLAGLPPPVVRYPIVGERAEIVTTVDLAYPEALVAIEYEGADHLTEQQVRRDGRRYTRLADLGWRVYRYFAGDVYRCPDRIVAEIHRALTTRVLPPPTPVLGPARRRW